MARGAQERSGTYALSTQLRVRRSISDAQLKELQRVAENCPVHKLMITVTTTIATGVERMPSSAGLRYAYREAFLAGFAL